MRKKVDTEYLICFGKNLKKVRENLKISQVELAIDCDFDVSVISRIERGVVNTSVDNLKKIAQALEIPVKDLFDF